METMTISPRDAHSILRSLREVGTPKKFGARTLSVGLEPIIEEFRQEYLGMHLTSHGDRDGDGSFKFVIANYGGGKTLLMFCLEQEAWESQYVVAYVELCPHECPLDNPERIYAAVAKSIQAPPSTPGEIDKESGLDKTLEKLIDKLFPGSLSGDPGSEARAQALEWVEFSLRNTPVDSISFREAVCRHLRAKLTGNEAEARKTAAYLRGDSLSASDLASIELSERLDKTSGMRWLRSMCQLIQRSGLAAGTILLFDEGRRSLSQMSAKAQRTACENLLKLINESNRGQFPGTMMFFAVMPEFFTDFADHYQALQGRCGAHVRINLEELGVRETDLLDKIGDRISGMFEIANEGKLLEKAVLRKNRKLLAEAAIKQSMGTGARRLFSIAWTNALFDLHKGEGEARIFSAEELERYVKHASRNLVENDKSTVESEGE